MKRKLVKRYSEEEMGVNTELLNEFSHAFSTFKVGAIMDLLHEQGQFFNDLNKGKAAGIFQAIFHGRKGIKTRNCIQFNRGIALDIFPGQEVLEIRCYNEEFDDDIFLDFKGKKRQKFGDPIVPSKDEVVFKFVFLFYEEKIFNLKMANKAIPVPDHFFSIN